MKILDVTAPKPPSVTDEDPLFQKIQTIVEDSEANTSAWSANQEKWHKMRMRIKKPKSFPFVGSSNLRMPTVEIAIRKVKAGVMNVLFGQRPVVQALPSPSGNRDTANKIEKLVDHLAMNVMDLEAKAEIGVDQSLEKGFYMLKPYWRREIRDRVEHIDLKELPLEDALFILRSPLEESMPVVMQRFDIDMSDQVADENLKAIEEAIDKVKDGEEEIDLPVKDVIYDFPDVSLVSPERCFVPTDSGFDPQETHSFTHEFFLSLDEVKRNAEFKGWENVDKLATYRDVNVDTATDLDKDTREGVSRMQNPGNLVRIWETYGWFDIGSGVQMCVITSFPDFKFTTRKVLLDSFSGKRPLVKLYYELTDDRWFSHRGVAEILEDIVKEIDVQHNMKIDSQTIRNAPMFIYRAGVINPNLVQTMPNQGIPVNGLQPLDDSIQVLNFHNPNTEYSYEREQMILETKVQEMIGQVDYSLQSMINKREPRTLGEVQEQSTNAGRAFSLDVKHYTRAFSELFSMIFELWCQYGSDEYEFLYFGESAKGEKIKLTKEEIQGKYKLTVRGNDNNTNPQVKLQKAQQIMLGATNPVLIQMGIIGPQQVANAVKRYYQALDVENPEELINLKPQPPQQDPKQAIDVDYEDLIGGERAQVLVAHGIKPDIRGQIAKENEEKVITAAELAEKLG